MQIVGDKLREWADSAKPSDEIDQFARSAINRYYYAAFLAVREILKTMDPKWAQQNHKGMPELIETTVAKKIRDQIKRSRKAALIGARQEGVLRDQLNDATGEVSKLLRMGYDARVTADYEPDMKIERRGSDFVLRSNTISAAQKWQTRAAFHSKRILKIWSDLGL